LPGPVPDRLRPVQRHRLLRPHRPPRRDRPALGPPVQPPRPQSLGLPPLRRPRPPFTPKQAEQVVATVETTDPAQHGLPGHGWTVKKLKQWVLQTFGLLAGRGTIRRLLRRANLTWKKVKKLLGKAKPEKRAAHVQEQLQLFARVCDGEVLLIDVDEVHV